MTQKRSWQCYQQHSGMGRAADGGRDFFVPVLVCASLHAVHGSGGGRIPGEHQGFHGAEPFLCDSSSSHVRGLSHGRTAVE